MPFAWCAITFHFVDGLGWRFAGVSLREKWSGGTAARNIEMFWELQFLVNPCSSYDARGAFQLIQRSIDDPDDVFSSCEKLGSWVQGSVHLLDHRDGKFVDFIQYDGCL